MSTPLCRTRSDLIATAVITTICVLCVGIAWLTAPIRTAELHPATQEQDNAGRLAVAATTLSEHFRLVDDSPNAQPVVVDGLIITYREDNKTVTATTAAGDTAWTYTRPDDLCALGQAWGKVVATYRTGVGCGDVVAIDALTGTYSATRSAIAPAEITLLHSNDRVGYAAASRVELWRSDMVRTVEYGEVEAPQEPNMQPHQCELSSALTRTELLAVTETCADGTFLRFQEVSPEDSRKPEMLGSVEISPDAYLVAIGKDVAAIYDPAESEIRAYNNEGDNVSISAVPVLRSPERSASGVATLATADLPHHMLFHDGDALVLMEPTNLAVTGVFHGALGTGFAAGDRLLYATEEGVAVVNWDTQAVENIVAVDRGEYAGPVHVDSAGASVVEKRGSEIVVLDAG